MSEPTDAELAALAGKMEVRLGLNLAESRGADLRRGVATAAAEFGQSDLGAFVRWLLSDRPAHTDLERFGGHLTVGETYFLRDRRTMSALEHVILPELICRNRTSHRLRIWCAGCSSGEEPYSLAMLLHRLLPDIRDWSILLLGADVNVQSLRKAEQGVYSRWSLRDCQPGELEPHVTQAGKDRYVVSDALRAFVTFSFVNLVEDSYPALATNTNALDLVVCRNVLMYFRQDRAAAVASRLVSCVVDGGYLILGPAELHLARGLGVISQSADGAAFFRRTGPETTRERQTASNPGDEAWAPDVRETHERTAGKSNSVPIIEATRPESTAGKSNSVPIIEAARPLRAAAAGEPPRRNEVESHARQTRNETLALARTLANRGQLDEALELCNRLLLLDRKDAEVHYAAGTIQIERGDPSAALVSLRKAIYLEPEFVMAHFASGMLARSAGRPDASLRHFRQALALLKTGGDDWEVPDSEGMLAGRLVELINQLCVLRGCP